MINKNAARVRVFNFVSASALGLVAGSALAVPAQMQAIVQTGNGGPEVMKVETVPVLKPAAGQVLIKVYAASVNPVDWKMRIGMGGPPRAAPAGGAGPAGAPPGEGPPPGGGPPGAGRGGPPGNNCPASNERIPGMDVAGVIVAVGDGVTTLKSGEAVFSMLGRNVCGLNGGYAQYALAPATNVVPKPKKLTYEQAAGLGTAGMTGARIVDATNPMSGQRVLITGVAGGVGSSAAQIAKARGAYVIGTASARHAQYLKSIGVDEVIDYTQGDWTAKVKDVDIAIDTVGGATATQALGTLKKGGTFDSVASRDITPAQCAAAGVTCVGGGPPGSGGPTEGDVLTEVAKLASEGKFAINVDKTYPLEQASDAQEFNRQGHTEGKVILIVDAAKADKK
jgi:NADPH2:quinone reductase